MDKSRQIRLRNVLMAAAGGFALIGCVVFADLMGHSIVSTAQLVATITLFCVVNVSLAAMVGSGLSERFNDPSLSSVLIYWASSSCFVALTLITDYHELIYFLLFTIIVFGVFSLLPADFRRYSLFIMVAQATQSLAANYLGSAQHSPLEILVYVTVLTMAFAILGQLCQSISSLRQRLQRKNTELQHALVAKDQFLANMSHELRTPMNGVLGMLDMLRSSTVDSTQLRHIDIAQSSGNTLISLINDILDYSKIRAGKLTLEQRSFSLISALQPVMASFYMQAKHKQVELIVDTAPDLPEQVTGDELRILQIFSNFISNAIKFTRQGTITISINLRQVDHQAELHCKVTDTGIGISTEALNSIFEQFTQADNATTRDYGGTGLGLSIAKRLIDLMDGDIAVESEEGAGSTFSFYIQLQGVTKKTPAKPLLSHYRVDLIDDLAAHHAVMQRYLQALGAQIHSHHNSALINLDDLIKDHHATTPHLIVLHSDDDSPLNPMLTPAVIDAAQAAGTVLLLLHAGSPSAINAGVIGLEKPLDFVTLYNTVAALQHTSPRGPSTAKAAAAPQPNHISIDRNKAILIIEDNLINQQVTTAMVKKLGISSQLANNGAEALTLLKSHPAQFGLILMDCQTPIMDGFAATKAIRDGLAGKANQHIPIIALTASALAGDRERCLAAGMTDYLSKPCDFSTLKNVLSQHLRPPAT